MKTKCYLYIAFSSLAGLFLQRANAQANTELSNLVSPTKVNQSLLPNNDNTHNLGSTTRSWKDIYFDGSIYLDGFRFLSNGNNVFSYNVFIGSSAGLNTTTGINNTAGGHVALFKNTTGSSNTAVGFNALSGNTTGSNNTANGVVALDANTTGNYNTADGYSALNNNTTGPYNTANGANALYSNTTGAYNTANGMYALYYNTIGGGNTASGISAGSFNDNNVYCTFIGYDANQSVSTDFTNSTALGHSSRITASNQVRIGNSSVTSIGGYEPWTNLSDGRFKKNVKENVPGLAFIDQLHAITYTMDVTKLRDFLGEDEQNEIIVGEDKMLREKDPAAEALIQKGIEEKEKIIRTGFSAQEVEEAAKKIGYDFYGVDKPQNEHTPYGLRYSEFVVPLVKAVQELSKMNDELQKQNEAQQKEIDEMKTIVLKGNHQLTSKVSSAVLEQNIPNPFNHTTTINYTLPEQHSSAKIIITDKNGKTLKELNVPGSGKGSLNVDAAMLSAGAYQYSLYMAGRLIDTKQMVLTK